MAALPPDARQPPPEAVPTDDRRAVLAGLVLWLVALVACLVGADALRARGDGWWLGVCVAGLALGLLGLVHLQRRHRRTR